MLVTQAFVERHAKCGAVGNENNYHLEGVNPALVRLSAGTTGAVKCSLRRVIPRDDAIVPDH